MIVKFHTPYMPNDGHGPGVPLPDWIYTYMVMLSGQESDLGMVLDILNENGDGEHGDLNLKFEDGGGYIRVIQIAGEPYPIHSWCGIKYYVVRDLEVQPT